MKVGRKPEYSAKTPGEELQYEIFLDPVASFLYIDW